LPSPQGPDETGSLLALRRFLLAVIETVQHFIGLPGDLNLNSWVMKAYAQGNVRNRGIVEMLFVYARIPSRFEEAIYVSQMIQAIGIKASGPILAIHKAAYSMSALMGESGGRITVSRCPPGNRKRCISTPWRN